MLSSTLLVMGTLALGPAGEARPSNYQHLKGLEFMIGDWETEGELSEDDAEDFRGKSFVYRVTTRWVLRKNAMITDWEVKLADEPPIRGKNLQGWNSVTGKIDELAFDSGGGHGHGTGQKDGDRWVFKNSGTDMEGRKVSSTSTITPIDADSYTVHITDRDMEGQSLPDIEVTLKRVEPGKEVRRRPARLHGRSLQQLGNPMDNPVRHDG
ncbi:MAG: hypothetical protein ACYTG0_32225 [Planctomycetota bacterium]